MKKIYIVTLVLILATSIYSENYSGLVKTGNKWNYISVSIATCWCEYVSTYSFSITTDTLIGGLSYKKLMCEDIEEHYRTTGYAGAIREDLTAKKVFIKYPNTPESILYDFNHKVGDTLFTQSDGYETIVRRVKSIETYNLNGESGQKFEICDSTYSRNGYKYQSNIENWYEGFGSDKILINPQQIPTYNHIGALNLLCFWSQDSMIYHTSKWTDCEYAYTISDLKENKIKQQISNFPNPANDFFTIDTELSIEKIKVFSVLGNLLLETSKKDVDISALSNGSYIVRVILTSGKTEELKLTKNNR